MRKGIKFVLVISLFSIVFVTGCVGTDVDDVVGNRLVEQGYIDDIDEIDFSKEMVYDQKLEEDVEYLEGYCDYEFDEDSNYYKVSAEVEDKKYLAWIEFIGSDVVCFVEEAIDKDDSRCSDIDLDVETSDERIKVRNTGEQDVPTEIMEIEVNGNSIENVAEIEGPNISIDKSLEVNNYFVYEHKMNQTFDVDVSIDNCPNLVFSDNFEVDKEDEFSYEIEDYDLEIKELDCDDNVVGVKNTGEDSIDNDYFFIHHDDNKYEIPSLDVGEVNKIDVTDVEESVKIIVDGYVIDEENCDIGVDCSEADLELKDYYLREDESSLVVDIKNSGKVNLAGFTADLIFDDETETVPFDKSGQILSPSESRILESVGLERVEDDFDIIVSSDVCSEIARDGTLDVLYDYEYIEEGDGWELTVNDYSVDCDSDSLPGIYGKSWFEKDGEEIENVSIVGGMNVSSDCYGLDIDKVTADGSDFDLELSASERKDECLECDGIMLYNIHFEAEEIVNVDVYHNGEFMDDLE